MIDKYAIAQGLIDRLAPSANDETGQRIWRFSERMATVYQQQMERFDEDEEARQWRRLYSADNMPPPSDTQSKADVAGMMAFYSPTNFCKFQKLVTQQLLEWHFRQAQIRAYPFGAPSIVLMDIGAGVGIASLAVVDLLATWAEVFAELGYRQLGLSVRIVAVEPDTLKQGPRQEMLTALSSVLDRHLVRVDGLTEIPLPYPEPQCIRQILDGVSGGSLAICCMSNFLSSLDTDQRQMSAPVHLRAGSETVCETEDEEVAQWAQSPIAIENAVRCATESGHLLAKLLFRERVLLAAELKQRGGIVRPFANALHSSAELAVHMNHIRFHAPRGSYWYSLRSGEQAGDPVWATGFWSLAHWVAGGGRFDGRQ